MLSVFICYTNHKIIMLLLICILIIDHTSISQAFTPEGYIGCFRDSSSRILTGKYRISLTNSGEECIQYCKTDGYRYAGTEYGRECYCGNEQSLNINSSNCTHACVGNKNEICGGDWAISVYKVIVVKEIATTTMFTPTTVKREAETETKITITSTSQNHVTSASNNSNYVSTGSSFSDDLTQTKDNNSLKTTHHSQSGIEAFTPEGYIGCFKDWKNRLLIGKNRTSLTNTGEECIQYCKTYGYRYAGTEYGNQCFCGKELRVKKEFSGCTYACGGNKNEMCGGYWAISVYKVLVVKENATTTIFKPSTVTREAIIEKKITMISTSQNHVTSASNNSYYVSTGTSFSDGLTQTIKTTHHGQSQTGTEDNSSGSTIIIVTVILTLVAIFVIVLAVIVMKKRKKRNGDNINQAYHEPTEKAPRKQQASSDDSEKVNNSHAVHNKILQQSDHIYVNNEVAAAAAADAAAQSTDGFYEMLQHKVDSGGEYTTLEMQGLRTNIMIHQDGLYEMLNKENQPEDLYSNIKQNQNN